MEQAHLTRPEAASSTPEPAAPSPAPAPSRLSIAQTAAPAVRLGESASVPAVSAGSGQPLQEPARSVLESRFDTGLDAVRVHSDGSANRAVEAQGARAFAYGSHIFLGSQANPSDIGVMAHEVAHVVQQQGAPTIQRMAPGQSDAFEREAYRAADAVERGESFTVQMRTGRPQVQRLGISDALDYFADKANNIPGFRMFTIIIGINPINMSRVERSAANVLRAIVEFIPGGHLIVQALDNYGIFERVGAWVSEQINSLGITGGMLRKAIMDFLDSLGWRDIFHLGSVWERAKRIFTVPIDRIISFGRGLITGIIKFVKDAILRPLAGLAQRTRGWDLLKAVLGRDPITGDPFPRTAETLIGGFMKLINQEEVWNNIKRANALPRAWAWFQGVLSGLLGYVRQIPQLFISALHQLELVDIVLLPRAFSKIAGVFGGFLGSFISWAGRQVLSLLEIIFDVVAPAAMPYLRKAAGAFRTIIQNPVGFIRNLVRAGIQGFRQFASNFLGHLRRSLIDWLTGTLEGAAIYIPQAFELKEIVKFVLSVLGLTWQNIRGKLLRLIPEPALRALETTFDLVVTLVREGPAAAWEKIRESLSNLKDMVMEGIMSFVQDRIVTAAITRLVSSLNPAGAFVQAVIAIYNTIMFFVERLRQIGRVVAAFIDSIAAIASGNIGTAASRVETTMAGMLTLLISFLARLIGLGKVSDAVKNIIDRVRAPIDRALDRVAEWILAAARRVGKLFSGQRTGAAAPAATPAAAPVAATQAPTAPGHLPPVVVPFEMAGEAHRLTIRETAGGVDVLMASSTELPMTTTFRTFYTELDDWRHFLDSIRSSLPADVQRQIDAKINHLRNIRQSQIAAYQEIYTRTFGSRRGDVGHRTPEREKEAVRLLTERARTDLAALREWAAQTGMPELTASALAASMRSLAKAAFDRTVAERRRSVADILARFRTPSGAPVRYRGSLDSARRGPHKAQVRFNPDDFDLDLFVVDPALHAQALASSPTLRAEFQGRPIPAGRAGGPALALQQRVVAALEAPNAVPGIRVGANYILVRISEP